MAARSVETTSHLTFAAAIFAGATLLFFCQPMVGRMIAPLLGGAPQVWIVCSLCFQLLLLAGYGYAHFVGTRLRVRVQVVLQLVLIASVFLAMPVSVDEAVALRLTAEHRTLGVFLLLLRTIGLPFFVLSTSSPLLQRWFAELGERDPYHLYAASNAGSMVALLGYPLVVEPLLAVRAQGRAYHAAFALYTVLVVVCAVAALRRPAPSRVETTPAPPQVRVTARAGSRSAPLSVTAREKWSERLVWLGLSFVPSSLLLGATEYVTTEVASVPLLWVLPLALYLMSFIVAFAKREVVPVRHVSFAMAVVAASVAIVTAANLPAPPTVVLGGHMLLLFLASVVCHRGLAERRPHVSRLTEFYLLLSIGGVLGGAFNGLLAPLFFEDLYEYPVAIALACLSRAAVDRRGLERRTLARHGLVAIALGGALFVGMRQSNGAGTLIWADRGFFGVLKVMRDRESTYRVLVSGRAMHGRQALDPAGATVPLAFYHPTGPAGDVLGPLPRPVESLPSRRVGVIGLGVGSLAAYARPGDHWTFFELNPAVVEVAHDYFTYVTRAEESALVDIELGDARQRIRLGDKQRFDILVLDAFSSDAVPTHLMTLEALAIYRQATAPGGLLLVHVSNDHVRLVPVLSAMAEATGMVAIGRRDEALSAEERTAGKAPSEWVVLAETRASVDTLVRSSAGWHALPPASRSDAWTDDYANVLRALKF